MENTPNTFTLKFSPKLLRNIILFLVAVLAIASLLWIVPALQSVINIVIIALFLSLILDPMVNFFENRGIQRLLGSILVFALIIFMAVLGFKFLAPVVSNEIKELSTGISKESPEEVMDVISEKLGNVPFLSNPEVQQKIRMKLAGVLERSLSVVFDILSAVISMVMLAFITFFFLKDGRRMKKAFISWVPNRYFEMSLIIIHKINTQLGRYIRGQLLVAIIVGALSVLALYLLEIRYYFFIGALAGIANMIPYFGPIVGATPAIIIAVLDTGTLGAIAAVAVAFASIQLFENVFVSPFIVSKSVELHPLTIIMVILIGGQLLGLFGMLLAVPVASIVKVTSREIAWGLKNYRIF